MSLIPVSLLHIILVYVSFQYHQTYKIIQLLMIFYCMLLPYFTMPLFLLLLFFLSIPFSSLPLSFSLFTPSLFLFHSTPLSSYFLLIHPLFSPTNSSLSLSLPTYLPKCLPMYQSFTYFHTSSCFPYDHVPLFLLPVSLTFALSTTSHLTIHSLFKLFRINGKTISSNTSPNDRHLSLHLSPAVNLIFLPPTPKLFESFTQAMRKLSP